MSEAMERILPEVRRGKRDDDEAPRCGRACPSSTTEPRSDYDADRHAGRVRHRGHEALRERGNDEVDGVRRSLARGRIPACVTWLHALECGGCEQRRDERRRDRDAWSEALIEEVK